MYKKSHLITFIIFHRYSMKSIVKIPLDYHELPLCFIILRKNFSCAAISRNKSLCRSISSKTLVFIISYSFAFALRIKCHKLDYFQKWFYIALSSIPSPSIPLHVCRCSQKLIVWQNVHHVTLPRTHDNPIDEMRRMDYFMKYAMRN